MKHRRLFSPCQLAILALGLVASVSVRAATVTVNGALTTGGGNYQTFKAALDAYPTWRNGSADTILVSDSTLNAMDADPADFLNTTNSGAAGLTIKNAPAAQPIIRLGAAVTHAIWLRVGKLTVEGLTFIGLSGVDGPDIKVFHLYTQPDLTIRNCVITANNGANQPLLDFAAAMPTTGRVGRAIGVQDATMEGVSSVRIERSVIAFCAQSPAIYWERTAPAGSTLTLDHTLVARNAGTGIRLRGNNAGNTFTLRKSAILDNGLGSDGDRRGMTFDDEVAMAVSFVLEDTIFGGNEGEQIIGSRFTGSWTATRCTFFVTPGADNLIFETHTAGMGNFTFTDCIHADGGDSFFRMEQLGVGVAPASLVLNNCAVAPPERAYRENQAQAIKNAFAALYGGAGPLGADPGLFKFTPLDASFAGIREWDSTSNFLFDVSNQAYGGKGSGGSNLSGGAEYVFGQPTPTPTPRPDGAFAVQKSENFDADPGWDGVNNHATQVNCRTTTQDFGWSNTNHAGDAAGEIGGFVTRALEPAYYALEITTTTLESAFSASGKVFFPTPVPGNPLMFGWFNSESRGWRTPNALFFRTDGVGDGFNLYLDFATQNFKALGIRFETEEETPQRMVFPGGVKLDWTLSYSPSGGDGFGLMTLTMNGVTRTVPLEARHRAEGAIFNRFGVLNGMTSGGECEFYVDDLVLNGTPINLASDPGWDEVNNRASYNDCDVRPRHWFGWGQTRNAGGEASGELGGLIWRASMADESLAYYGDEIGPLDGRTDGLFASGRVGFVQGASDSGAFIGWFNAASMVGGYNPANTGFPQDFLGVFIEGPSREGFFFRPVYRTHGDGLNDRGDAQSGPYILPDGSTHDWEIQYDPQGNGGNGRITVTLDGESKSLPLAPGHKNLGSIYDRFGMITTQNDGHYEFIYFDDLEYTTHYERANETRGEWLLAE